MKYLGGNLKLILKRFDWSADDLGRRLGMGRGAAANWLSGKSEPGLDKLGAIERMTGVGMSRLVFSELRYEDLPLEPVSGWREERTEDVLAEPDGPGYHRRDEDKFPRLVDTSGLTEMLMRLEERLKVVEGENAALRLKVNHQEAELAALMKGLKK